MCEPLSQQVACSYHCGRFSRRGSKGTTIYENNLAAYLWNGSVSLSCCLERRDVELSDRPCLMLFASAKPYDLTDSTLAKSIDTKDCIGVRRICCTMRETRSSYACNIQRICYMQP